MKIILCEHLNLKELEKSLGTINVFFHLENNILEIDDIDYLDVLKVLKKDEIVKVIPCFNLDYVLRANQKEDTLIELDGLKIGGSHQVIIAGPCAVKDYDTMREIAISSKKSGVDILRAGAFKMRTNPKSYQGIGLEGLNILKKIREEFSLPVISEITDIKYIPQFVECVDIIQVGARNMQNFALLEALGKIDKPILLKRGFNNSIEELLCSAEYIIKEGNHKVILCERGIRTPQSYTRNTLDFGAALALKSLTHLPIIIDPSHATGKRKLVLPIAKASLMLGFNGVMIEASTCPNREVSDSEQTIDINELKGLKNR